MTTLLLVSLGFQLRSHTTNAKLQGLCLESKDLSSVTKHLLLVLPIAVQSGPNFRACTDEPFSLSLFL